MDQRVTYCQYWQKKLKGNKDVEFPNILCGAIARITDEFSFAYIQEAFVATLLVIASSKKEKAPHRNSLDEWQIVEYGTLETSGGGDDKDELDKYFLWREIKKQVGTLRRELNSKRVERANEN